MGRPSLADERRPQILDAVIRCMLRSGVSGATVAAVADEAGVQPSIIRHYVGNRDDFIGAAVQRALADVTTAVIEPIATLPPAERLDAQLDLMFGGPLDAPGINQLIDQLVADSYLSERTRTALAGLYRDFQHLLLENLGAAHPHASDRMLRQAATAVLALAHAGATFTWLDFDADSAGDNRSSARILVQALLAS